MLLAAQGLEQALPAPVPAVMADATGDRGDGTTPNVALVGGGPAGLAAAWMMQSAGVRFSLFEGAQTRPSPPYDCRPNQHILEALD